MKKLIARIVVNLLVVGVFFFAGAFMSMQINPEKWDTGGRIIFVVLTFWGMFVVNLFFNELTES